MKSAHMATKRRKEKGVDKYLTIMIMKPLVTIYYNDTRDSDNNKNSFKEL